MGWRLSSRPQSNVRISCSEVCVKSRLRKYPVVLLEPHDGLRCFLRTLVNQTSGFYFAGEASSTNGATVVAGNIPDRAQLAGPLGGAGSTSGLCRPCGPPCMDAPIAPIGVVGDDVVVWDTGSAPSVAPSTAATPNPTTPGPRVPTPEDARLDTAAKGSIWILC